MFTTILVAFLTVLCTIALVCLFLLRFFVSFVRKQIAMEQDIELMKPIFTAALEARVENVDTPDADLMAVVREAILRNLDPR